MQIFFRKIFYKPTLLAEGFFIYLCLLKQEYLNIKFINHEKIYYFVFTDFIYFPIYK